MVNAGGWGMFRVGYETAHRLALADHLTELTALERANLLADTWATTLAGLSSLREFLVLASRLGTRARSGAVGPGRVVHSFSVKRIAWPEHEDMLRQAVADLIGPTHLRLGFDAEPGESERTPSLRALAINLLGTVGADPEVRVEAARRFDASPIGGGSGDADPGGHRDGGAGRRRPAGAPG